MILLANYSFPDYVIVVKQYFQSYHFFRIQIDGVYVLLIRLSLIDIII